MKTDRLDGERLLEKLKRHYRVERGGWSVVRCRAWKKKTPGTCIGSWNVSKERLAHRVRMHSLLVTQGLKLKVKRAPGLCFDGLTLCDARALPEQPKAELERERQRLVLVERQIEELEANRRERLKSPRTEAEHRVVHLMRLGAIGPASAWLLVMEFFGWRAFRNRREPPPSPDW